MRIRRFLSLLVLSALFGGAALSQPTWVATTPSYDSSALYIDVSYGLQDAGDVYGFLISYEHTAPLTAQQIKDASVQPTNAGRIRNINRAITGGDIGTIITEELKNDFAGTDLNPGQIYTLYLVGQDDGNNNFTAISRYVITSQSCPTPANTYLGFSTVTGENCVNLGDPKRFRVITYNGEDGSDPSNILKDAQWTVVWGDGSADWTFTSTYDNDGPGGYFPFLGFEQQQLTHVYTRHDTCSYDIQLTVIQPGVCAPIGGINQIFAAPLWAPDDDTWGNGEMLLVNDEDDSPDTIRICEGNEAHIVVRDASTWDCDGNFIVEPDPSADVNAENRVIQFTYGRAPDGSLVNQNTISGIVQVGAAGTAESGVSGHYSIPDTIVPPDPVANPETESDTIVIPASCQAGEYFKVYVKDWNQCNPYTGAMTPATNSDYVFDEIVILVIESPPAPTTPDRVVCLGDDETLTVTSPPVGQFNWYFDGLKTNPIPHTGATYDPSLGTVGIDTFYVADEELAGDLCEGPPDTVVIARRESLVISEAITGDNEVCEDETNLSYSLASDAPVMPVGGATQYVWSVTNGTITAGQNTKSITVTAGSNPSVDMTVSVVLEYTSAPNCPSGPVSLVADINPIPVGTPQTLSAVCHNTNLNIDPQDYTDVPGSSFTWSGDNGSSGNGIIDDSPDNTGASRINVIYTVTPTGPATSSCEGADFDITVPVDPEPEPGTFSVVDNRVCDGDDLQFSLTGHKAWDVRLRLNDGGWSNVTGFQDATGDPVTIDFPSTDGDYPGPGTWDFRPRLRYRSCGTTDGNIVSVTIDPVTVGGAVTPNRTVCQGSTSGLLTLGGGYVGDVTQWWVDDGGGYVAIPGTAGLTSYTSGNLNTPGTYRYRAEIKSGECNTEFSTPAVVTVDETSDGGTLTGANDICNGGDPTALSLQGGSYVGGVVRWEVDVNGGGFSTVGGASGTSYDPPSTTTAGTHDYRVVIQNGVCAEDVSSVQRINVNNALSVTASITDSDGTNDGIVCEAGQFTFNATVGSPGTPGYTYDWDNGTGDSFTGTGVAHQPPLGAHTYTLTLTDAFVPSVGTCTATDNVDAERLTNPTVNIAPPGNQAVCVNTDLNLDGQAVAGTRPISTYAWTGDTGPLDDDDVDDVVFNTATPGVYSITYTVTDNYGCLATDALDVTASGPEVSIDQGATSGVCSNTDLALSTSETYTGGVFDSRAWTGEFDGGGGYVPINIFSVLDDPSSSTPTFNAAAQGLYRLTVQVNDDVGCSATAQIIITVSTVSASISPDPAEICEDKDLTLDGNPTGGSGVYTTNTWLQISGPGAWTLSTGSSTSTFNGEDPGNYLLRYFVEDNNGCSYVHPDFTVTVFPEVDPGTISSADNDICYNTTPNAFTSTVDPSGGQNLDYQWQYRDASTAMVWTDIGGADQLTYTEPGNLTADREYRRATNSDLQCDTKYSNVISINVWDQLNGGVVASAVNDICYNTIPNAFTNTTSPSGGTALTYRWQHNNATLGGWTDIAPAETGLTYTETNTLTESTDYRRVTTSGDGCGSINSNTISINVYGQLDPGTIGNADLNICYNTNPPIFTNDASPSGGVSLTYQWQHNSVTLGGWTDILGETGLTYTETGGLTENTSFRRVTNSGGGCGSVISNEITINVYDELLPGTIGSLDNNICYNTIPNPFTDDTSPSGGTGLTYQWQHNSATLGGWTDIGTATLLTYTETNQLTEDTQYRRVTTSADGCGSVISNVISITVYDELTPGTIGNTDLNICYNTLPQVFTNETSPAGGTALQYQWEHNSITLGGWTSIGGATGLAYTETNPLTETTQYRRVTTSGDGCGSVISNVITINVYDELLGGTIGSADNDICYNTIPNAFTNDASPSGGTTLAYQWEYRSASTAMVWTAIGGATALTYAEASQLTEDTEYRRATTSGDGCGTVYSNVISINVWDELLGGTVGSAVNDICYNTIPNAFTDDVSPTGGTGLTYQWQHNSVSLGGWTNIVGANALTYTETNQLTEDTQYRRATSSADGCGTVYSNVISINVYGDLDPGTIGNPDLNICYNTTPQGFTNNTSPTGGVSLTYQWEHNNPTLGGWTAIVGVTTLTYTPAGPITETTDYRRVTTSGSGCGTVISNVVTINVWDELLPGTVGSAVNTICYNTIPNAFTDDVSPTGGTGLTYQWQHNNATLGGWTNIFGANALTYTETNQLTESTDYRRATTSGDGCGTVNSNILSITVRPELLGGTIGTDHTICHNNPPNTLTSSVDASGGDGSITYTWHYTEVLGATPGDGNWTAVPSSDVNELDYDTLTASTKFVREAIDGTCGVNDYSNMVTVTVNPPTYVSVDDALIEKAEDETADIGGEVTGAINTGTWTLVTVGSGSIGAYDNIALDAVFTPVVGYLGEVVIVLSSDDSDGAGPCEPVTDTVRINYGQRPIADAGDDLEECEPADSLLHLSGWAKKAANDANWFPVVGNGSITSHTKTWSVPQSPTPDENDSLFVEAVYKLAPSDYGTPSGFSTFTFELITNDPDGAGPVSPHTDNMDYVVNWGPSTPDIGGGGKGTMCVNDIGNFYSVPLTAGNDYDWTIEVLTGGGVPGVDYIVQGGGDGNNFIVVDWITVGTYNLKVTETTYQTDGLTPCVGTEVVKPIAIYNPPVVTTEPDTTICIGDVISLRTSVTDGSGDYSYVWAPAVGLSSATVAEPDVTGLFVGPIGYNLTVTDNVSGCNAGVANVTITVNAKPSIYTLSGPEYFCDGATTGVTLILSDSEADVDYSLYNGAVLVSMKSGDGDSIAWTNNFAGSYFVEAVRNAVPACEETMAGIVNVTPNPAISVTEDAVVEPLCNGGSDGSISITPGGGTAPYTYLWSGPGPFNSTNEDITGLIAGDYTVVVTDSRSCEYTHTPITVGEPDAMAIQSITETQAVTCYGGTDGEATVVVDPATGTAPYTYQWYYDASFSNPVVGAVSSVLSGVAAATYYVICEDVNGCTVNGNVAITQPTEITGSGSVTTPVSCNGDSDGVITVSASGGSGTFQYDTNGANLWQAANTFTVGAGTYTLRVRDAAVITCIVALTDVVVSEPDVLVASGSVTSNYNGAEISCPPATDGQITASQTGGTAPYQYEINGGGLGGSAVFNGLGAGTHTINIEDARGCTDTEDVTITAPVAISGTVAATSNHNGFHTSCNGASDGEITVTPAGGTGVYTYELVEDVANITGRFSGIFSGLVAGDYSVEITDANGCQFTTAQTTVNQPDVLSATVTPTMVTCFNAADGIIDITLPTGGTGGYEYSINGGAAWQASGNFTNLTPQSYNVQIRDDVNTACVVTLNAALAITQPSILDADISITNVTCNGDGDGTITVDNPSGGYGTYQYSIDGGTGWENGPAFTFDPVAPSTYTVLIRDAAQPSCQITLSTNTVISEPSALSASGLVTSSYNGSEISCADSTDGQITVTATGGTGPYQYEIDGGGLGGSNVFSGLGDGTYVMGVEDANGCTATDNVTITEPAAMSGTHTVTSDYSGFNVSCFGLSDATIDVVAGGGTGAYTYEIVELPGNLTGRFTGDFSGIAQGNYTVLITDANSCPYTTPIAVTVSEPPVLTGVNAVSSSYNGSDVSCFGESDGEITVTPGGGTGAGTYDFLLIQNPGNTTGNATGIYTGLPAGTYTVRVTDDNSCTMTSNGVTLDNPAQITASIAKTSDHGGADISCPGGTDGEITVTASGGTVGLRYKLVEAPSNETGKSTGIFTGLSAGTYSVQVFDSNGCFITTPYMTLNDPLTISAFSSITSNHNGSEVSCVGASDGEITVSAFGGTGLLHYVLNEDVANTTGADNGIFTGLDAGSYTITVSDSNGCTVITAAVSIDDPPALSGSTTIISNYNGAHVSCFGDSDGIIRTTATGGTGLLSYQLLEDTGNTSGDATGIYTGLASGDWTVRITDANGCNIDAATVTINDPVVVSETHSISSDYNGSHVSCAGVADGEITVNGAGGTGTLTYVLDQDLGNTTGNLSGIYRNVGAGTWTVTVTDMNGCDVTTANIDIIDPPAVTSTAVKQSPYNGEDISCFGGSDGLVDVTGGGGTGGYTYAIVEVPTNTTGETTGNFTGLSAGTFTFTTTDDNGCSATSAPVMLTQPTQIAYTINISQSYNGSDVSCPGDNDGEITVVGSDGTGTLSYVLDQDLLNVSGNSNGIYTGLFAGTYTVTITDQNLCTVQTSSVTLDDPTPISATSSVTSNYNGADVSCFGASDGIMRAVASGGSGTLSYTFDSIPANVTGASTGEFTGLPSGIYTITVTDLNGCTFTTAADTIEDPVAISASAAVTSDFNGEHLSCFGTNDGELTVTALGGTGAYTYVLDQQPTNITGRFSGVFQGLSSGTYSVSVTDANSCPVTTADVDINDPAQLTATGVVSSDYEGSDISCFGESDGEITITPVGGTGAVGFELIQIPANTTGDVNGIYTGLPSGAYTVRVTDANGCTYITDPVTVSNPPLLTATASVTSDYNGSELSCNGASDGEVTVTAIGGTGNYRYELQEDLLNTSGNVSGIYTNLSSGSYTVKVLDTNDCEVITTAVTIDEPTVLSASAAVTSNYNGSELSCFSASDGIITVTATGGTGTLSYALNPAVNTTGDVTGIYTGLPSGTYDVTVTDLNLCDITTASVTIDEPDEVTGSAAITSDFNGSHVSCIGASDGEITVTAIGGTVSLEYSSNGGLSWQNDPVFDLLPAATYHIVVRDVNNCQLDLGNIDIVNPAQVVIDSVRVTSDYNGRHISCATASDGEATVYAVGGTTNLTGNLNYEWFSDPAYTVSTGHTSDVAALLPAGIYYVKVWDDNDCAAYGNVTVTAPPALFGTATVTSNFNGAQVSCFNATDGEITIMAFNGTPGYEYSADGRSTWSKSNVIGSLGAGNHDVWIRDTNSCEYNVGATLIIEPSEVIANASVTSNYFGQDVTCVGASDGQITVIASGGTGALEYSIDGGSNWQFTPIFGGLSAGTYNIDVKDANDCGTSVNGIVINDPPALTGSAAVTSNHNGAHVSCNGAFDGEITITVTSSGSGTVMYSYNGGTTYQALPNFTNLNAGTYNMFIRDINMCETDLGNVTIVDPPAMLIDSVYVSSDHNGRDISCVGAGDGAATVVHNGGTGTIHYEWYSDAGYNLSIGQTTQTATGLSAGTYYIKVYDDNDCVAYGNVTLADPPALSSTISITSSFTGGYHVSCNGAADGSVDLTPSGGTAPYTYAWTGPSIVIGTNDDLEDQASLLAGTYDVTITDDNGCTTTAQAVLLEPNVLTVTASATVTYNGFDVTCNGATDGGITTSVAGGSGAGTYSYLWTGPGVTGSTDPSQANVGAGAYTVDVTDDNGCTAQANITLTEPTVLQAVATSANDYNGFEVSCYGGNDGGINLDTIGGVSPYTYSWTGPLGFVSNAQNLIGLRAGTYDVTLRDANGCTDAESITLTEPNQLAATATVTSDYFGYGVSCNGNSDADIDLVITEGVGPYTVLWTGPSIDGSNENNEDLTGMAAGLYQATITDDNGCIITANVTVTEPAALNPGQITGTQMVCYLSNPTLLNQAFGASGGPTTRTYQWEISTTSDTGPFTDISGATGPTYDPPDGITQTSYYRRAVSSGACATEYSNVVTVTVNPLPVAALSGDAEICEGTSSDISVAITSGTAPFVINIDNGVGVVSNYRSNDPVTVTPFSAPVTYSLVSVIDSFGCQVFAPHADLTGSATITWKEKVGISDQPDDTTICETQDAGFSVTATGETPYSYQWYENNNPMAGETDPTLDLTGVPATSDGNYYFVEVTDGCGFVQASDIAYLTVQTNTVITAHPQTSDICEGLATSFSVEATGTITGYQWQEDNGGGMQNLAESGQYVGTTSKKLSVFGVDSAMTNYRYQVIITGICTPSVTSDPATLIVKTSPVIYMQPRDTAGCETVPITFSVSAHGDTLDYQWYENSGGGFAAIPEGGAYTGTQTSTLTLTSPQVTTQNGNLYRVIVSGACNPQDVSEAAILTVNTFPAIVQDPIDEELCEDGSVTFLAGATGTGIDFFWQEDDGNGFVDITDGGIYSGANSQSLTLTNIPVTNNGYRYRLQVRGNCATVNSKAVVLTVNANPTASLSGDGNYPIVCGGLPLALDGNPQGGTEPFTTHKWTGDVFFISSDSTRTTTFRSTAHGTYSLTYTVTDSKGCKGKDQTTITNDRPDVRFTTDVSEGCGSLPVTFTNESNRALTYEWDMADPANPGIITDEHPVHDFENFSPKNAYFNVQLVGTSDLGCHDTARYTISVYPSVDATFTIDPASGCNPVNAILETTPGGSKYVWDFGNDEQEQGSHRMEHRFENSGTDSVTYTVTLVTTSAIYECQDQKTATITVHPSPTVQFIPTPSIQQYPAATVEFENLTQTGSWSYEWDFDDGSPASDSVSPTHTYQDPGTYKVTLTAITDQCSSSKTNEITIEPATPIADFEQPEFGCTPHTVTFVNNSQYATENLNVWEFGDGSSLRNVENPSYTYNTAGTYDVALTVTGPGGTHRIVKEIIVYLRPTANFGVAPQKVFVNDVPVKCFNRSSDTLNAIYHWDFGDKHTTDTAYPAHVYTEPGRYDISLTVSNVIDPALPATSDNVCSHTTEFSYVEVEPGGDMQFPTVFKPNLDEPGSSEYRPGQDNNAVFFPGVYNQVHTYELVIYNRWGEQIFRSTNVNIGWNGWVGNNSKPAEQGVYIWRVRGKYTNGQNFSDVGDITLLK